MTKARDTANLTGSGVTLPLLDIDAGTDIGAALVDADLMIVDDGAGGTNRKATMSRLATYMGTKIGGGMDFLASSGVISNAATVSFTQFDASAYDHYRFFFQNVVPASDDVEFRARTSTDGGSSYDSGGSDYLNYNDNRDHWNISGNGVGSAADETGMSGEALLVAPHLVKYTVLATANLSKWEANGTLLSGAASDPYAGLARLAAADVDAIQFYFESGNIESGEITMFGIVNS